MQRFNFTLRSFWDKSLVSVFASFQSTKWHTDCSFQLLVFDIFFNKADQILSQALWRFQKNWTTVRSVRWSSPNSKDLCLGAVKWTLFFNKLFTFEENPYYTSFSINSKFWQIECVSQLWLLAMLLCSERLKLLPYRCYNKMFDFFRSLVSFSINQFSLPAYLRFCSFKRCVNQLSFKSFYQHSERY